mgnify:FL=1
MDYSLIATAQPDATDAEQQIRALTVEGLADRYRGLPTLTLEDLSPDEGTGASRAIGRLEDRASYLDEWLERRSAIDEATEQQGRFSDPVDGEPVT